MKNRASSIALAAAFAALLAGCATMAPSPAKTVDGALVNDAGMTLYTFDRDVGGSGKSVCNGPCAVNWPPLRATTDTPPNAAWQIVTRDDGCNQCENATTPLYTWLKDTKPGDRTGDGVNNAWRVARP